MDKNLFFYELEGRGYIFQNKKWDEAKHGFEDDMLNMAWEMWSSAKHSVKSQAVPEGFVEKTESNTHHYFKLKDWDEWTCIDGIKDAITSDNDINTIVEVECLEVIEINNKPCFALLAFGKRHGTEVKFFDTEEEAIEAQESAPLKLGDLVEPIDHRYTLASGCERYPYAYVVNTNPFQLMSEEGDMYWCCTVEAGGYKLIKSNDQLPEAVSLRMIREGLLAPVEAQEQSHD